MGVAPLGLVTTLSDFTGESWLYVENEFRCTKAMNAMASQRISARRATYHLISQYCPASWE